MLRTVDKPTPTLDPKIQLLAEHLATEDLRELSPVPDIEFGVRYPEVEKITGYEAAAAKKWLEALASKGILETRFLGKLLICPKCGSSDTPVHYFCPTCRSIEIEKKALLEHLACGLIEKDDNFGRAGQQVCPRCTRPLGVIGVEYREAGTWYLCRNCRDHFTRPQAFHVCSRCKDLFTIENASLQDILAYRLAKETEVELVSGVMFLKPLKALMEGLGYEVTVTNILHGASQTVHIFELLCVKGNGGVGETVAVDVVASDRFGQDPSVATYFLKEAYWHLFAKRYETNPNRSVLVAIPAVHEAGRKLAALYNVALIEAVSASEAVERLRAYLSS